MQTHEIVIDQAMFSTAAQLRYVTATELGLSTGEAVKVHITLTELRIDPDGAPIYGTGPLTVYDETENATYFRVTNYLDEVEDVQAFIGSDVNGAAQIFPENGFAYCNDTNISGGGPNATIKIKLFYEIIQF
jgi:hypothetical protein